jgi:hypothetical protein
MMIGTETLETGFGLITRTEDHGFANQRTPVDRLT